MASEGRTLHLYTDGGARGNPGPAGIGAILKDDNGLIAKDSQFIGRATNNEAEYKALILGLGLAKRYDPKRLICFLDSELVASQLNGRYKIKNGRLRSLVLEIKTLEQQFPEVVYQYIPRSQNKEADRLVNEVIDSRLNSKSEYRSSKQYQNSNA